MWKTLSPVWQTLISTLVLVAVVLVLFVTPLGGAVWDKFNSVTTSLGGTSPGGKPVP